MNLITNDIALIKFCDKLRTNEFITVDTEFTRDKTYFPKLCLIQLSDGINTAAIDPFTISNLEPIWQIMFDDKIIKVLHAAKQDLELIYGITGKFVNNIFDTQIAASFCGYGETPSYADLVHKILNIKIDKSIRYTNWETRPLSNKQLRYALKDVSYLIKIYYKLHKELLSLGRLDWIEQEINELKNPNNLVPDTESAWQRIKFKSKSRRFAHAVYILAKWREEKAIIKNLPRHHIFNDKILLEICTNTLTTTTVVNKLLKNNDLDKDYCREINTLFKTIIGKNKYFLPTKINIKNITKNTIKSEVKAMVNLLLKLKAMEHKISARAIASSSMIDQLIGGENDSPLLLNWRYNIFGKDALALLDGKIAIQIKHGKVTIIH